MVKKIIFGLFVWKILVSFLALPAVFFLPLNKGFIPSVSFRVNIPYIIWIWGNFDGVHYMEIARNGYHNFQFGFFPLYPFVIQLINSGRDYGFFFPYLFIGQVISILCFFLSLFVMTKLLELDGKKRIVNIFLLSIFLFPTSFFLGSVYNDSLFLFLATTCLYFARKNKWFLSGIIGGLATLTRLNGLALFFFVLIEYIESFRNETNSKSFGQIPKFLYGLLKKSFSLKEILNKRIWSIFFIPGAFALYLSFVNNTYGNWNFVFSSMSIWKQDKTTFPLQVFWRYFKIIFLHPTLQINYWVALAELFFVFFYIFLLIFLFKKIRFSYLLFFALSIVIPSLTGTFAGMPRYGLHLYPFFLGIAILLYGKGKIYKILYFTISITLMIFCISLFTRGYFIA